MLRATAIEQLRRELPGKNLYDLARAEGITIERRGKKNKGWVGQAIERAARLTSGNARRPDGLDFELKSTTLLAQPDGTWSPKETIKITQLNPHAILEETFESSTLWLKLSRWIFVGCHHASPTDCNVVCISAIDLDRPELVEEIRSFWEDVRHTLVSGEMIQYFSLGTSSDLVQLRPTGDGRQWSRCPVTGERFPARAFYATKRLIREILEPHLPFPPTLAPKPH